jgi:polysaccharide export outer membrane protein
LNAFHISKARTLLAQMFLAVAMRKRATSWINAVWCATLIVCLAATEPPALAQAPQPAASDDVTGPYSSGFQQRYPRYEVRAGDVFTLEFQFTPEFNQTVTILPDGYVNLRGVGDIYVAGKTVPELTDVIRDGYNKILNKPSMIVALKDFDKPYFVAAGQVQRPGKYELRADTTVVEGIAIAGGLTDSAKHSQVVLFRKISRDWMEGTVLDIKKMLHEKNLNEDLHLKPGDMIIVPQSTSSKIRRYIPVPGIGIGINY